MFVEMQIGISWMRMTICTSIINENHNEEKSFCKRLL